MGEVTNTATIRVVGDASDVADGFRPAIDAAQRTGAAVEQIGDAASASAQNVNAAQRTITSSVQRTTAAMSQAGSGAAAPARNIDAAQRNITAAIQRTTLAMQTGGRGTAAYYEALARQRGVDPHVLAPYLAQLRAIEQAQAGAGHSAGASAGQIAAAMRTLPAQVHDIFSSLQGGQNPLTVLTQQGGQLSDQFGGAGAAARALGGYVLGLVNPLTIGAAAVAGLAYVYKKGRDEINSFNAAVITSGNRAGTTADQMSEVARLAAGSGSRGAAAGVVNGLVQSGQVQAQSLQIVTQATIDAQKILGRAVEDTEAEFEKMGKAPLQGLRDIDDKYHSVTASTYAQVKALQDLGRYTEAANVAQQAYADGIEKNKQAVLDNMTDWERGWIRIKDGISGTIDKLLHLRESTSNEKISALFKENQDTAERIESLKKRGAARDGDKYDASKDPDVLAAQAAIDANEREIKSIWDKQAAKNKAALDQAKKSRADDARKAITENADILLPRQVLLQRQINALNEESTNLGLTQAEAEKRRQILLRQNYDIIVNGIERQIEAIRRRTSLQDLKAQPAAGQINIDRTTGAITGDQALQRSAQIDFDALDRQKKALQDQLALVMTMRDSERQQDDLRGQLAENQVNRTNRQIKLTQDLFLADYQSVHSSIASFSQFYDQLYNKTQDMRGQVQQQKDYNEQIGLGSKELLDLVAARREDLALTLERKAIPAEGYDLDGKIAQQYRDQAKALRDRNAAEREGYIKERDPYVNLDLSLKRYAEDAQNIGGQIGDALTNAFRSAEDAFANFVTTGKLGFSDLTKSILADFARIEAKQALGSLATSLLGSMGSSTTSGWGASLINAISGARADGGPVNAGLSYLVGERGPEIFTPASSGSITPNHMIGAGGGAPITIQTNVQVTSSGTATSTTGDSSTAGKALADMITSKAKEVVARETRQGGIIWKLQQGRA